MDKFVKGVAYRIKEFDVIVDNCEVTKFDKIFTNDKYGYIVDERVVYFSTDMAFLCGRAFEATETSEISKVCGFNICRDMCESLERRTFKEGVCYRVKPFESIRFSCNYTNDGDYVFHNGDDQVRFTEQMCNICGKTFIANSNTSYVCALGWFLVPQMCDEVVSEEINFNKYVHEAMRTKNNDLDHKLQLLDGACGLAGESGEVVDAIKKYNFQGHDLDKAEIENELGDVLWYVALICDTLSINLEDVARKNLDKLRTRYPEGFSTEDSLRRVDNE